MLLVINSNLCLSKENNAVFPTELTFLNEKVLCKGAELKNQCLLILFSMFIITNMYQENLVNTQMK